MRPQKRRDGDEDTMQSILMFIIIVLLMILFAVLSVRATIKLDEISSFGGKDPAYYERKYR